MKRGFVTAKLDLDGYRANLLRRGTPARVFHFEHGIGSKVKGQMLERFGLGVRPAEGRAGEWRAEANLYRTLGIELFRVYPPGASFQIRSLTGRGWANEHGGPIGGEEDVERYPWPRVGEVDFAVLDWYEKRLPPDMGVFVKVSMQELVVGLVGFEPLCFMLFDRPDLVREIARRVGEFHTALAEALCGYRCVFALYGCDDFGFKTSTLLPPEVVRRDFLPWHKRWAEIAHARGKYYFLHSCGNLAALMDDIIDDVRADAKHSFEEAILPVDRAKALYGHRLSLLGGLDVDWIARSDEARIRAYTRRVLERCVPGGGYFAGLGNWVTDYIPLANYLTMLDEARRFGASGF